MFSPSQVRKHPAHRRLLFVATLALFLGSLLPVGAATPFAASRALANTPDADVRDDRR